MISIYVKILDIQSKNYCRLWHLGYTQRIYVILNQLGTENNNLKCYCLNMSHVQKLISQRFECVISGAGDREWWADSLVTRYNFMLVEYDGCS